MVSKIKQSKNGQCSSIKPAITISAKSVYLLEGENSKALQIYRDEIVIEAKEIGHE